MSIVTSHEDGVNTDQAYKGEAMAEDSQITGVPMGKIRVNSLEGPNLMDADKWPTLIEPRKDPAPTATATLTGGRPFEEGS